MTEKKTNKNITKQYWLFKCI